MYLTQSAAVLPRRNLPTLVRNTLAILGALGLLAAGFGTVSSYQSNASRNVGPPSAPVASANLFFRDPRHLSLVVALRPSCDASRAAIDELTKICRAVPGEIRVTALILQLGGEADSSVQNEMRSALEHLEARVVADHAGATSARFGFSASGQIKLFSPNGKLLYDGGITSKPGRGGENPGVEMVLEIARGTVWEVRSGPVFGCPLFDAQGTVVASNFPANL